VDTEVALRRSGYEAILIRLRGNLYNAQYIQIRAAGALLAVSSLALSIPVLFVCLGNTGLKGGDLTQAGEATVFHPQTTGDGSKGGHVTQRGPVGSSSGIFQPKLRMRSHPFSSHLT